jgi:hypothetical protein
MKNEEMTRKDGCVTTVQRAVMIGMVALGLTSCGGSADLNSTLPESNTGNGSGTAIYVVQVLSSLRIADSHSGAQIAYSFEVTTTGSTDSAIVTAAINGGAATQVGVIQPQDFNHGIRNKTASYACTLGFPYGYASVQFCFVQSGAQGRESKETCVPAIGEDACKTGTGNCDGDNSNGCETDLTTSSDNCGACGVRCHGNEVCSAGACTTTPGSSDGGLLSVLDGGLLSGGGSSSVADGGSSSAPTCAAGWASCGNDPAGCETALHTEENCNHCGDACDSNAKCELNTDGSYSCHGSSS